MKKQLILLLSLVVLVSVSTSRAGDLEGNLRTILVDTYGKAYIKDYVQPLSTALGTSLGGALFHRGYTKGFPRFDIGVSTAFINLPDEAKTFASPVPGQGDVPTFFGSDKKGDALVSGINSDVFGLPMLHANIGLFANLELTARYAAWDVTDIGTIGLYGGGVKYGLSDLIPIPMFPLDFALQAAYHKFTVGKFLDSGTFSMNFQASGSIPVLPIDIYGGIGYDSSSLTLKTKELGTDLGDITVDGENSVRFNVGVSLTLLFFNVHADYNIGKYKSLAGGIMFVL